MEYSLHSTFPSILSHSFPSLRSAFTFKETGVKHSGLCYVHISLASKCSLNPLAPQLVACLQKHFGIERSPQQQMTALRMTLNDNSAGTCAEELLLLSFGFNLTAMRGLNMTDGKRLLGFLPLQMESGMSD